MSMIEKRGATPIGKIVRDRVLYDDARIEVAGWPTVKLNAIGLEWTMVQGPAAFVKYKRTADAIVKNILIGEDRLINERWE